MNACESIIEKKPYGLQTQSSGPLDQENLCRNVIADAYERRQELAEPYVVAIKQGSLSSSMPSLLDESATGTIYRITAYPLRELSQVKPAEVWNPDKIINLLRSYSIPSQILDTSSGSEPREPSVNELIERARKLNVPFAEKMANRIEYLASICQEEYPDQAPISPCSLQTFIAFVSSVPNLVYPSLVLTWAGNIRAEWTKAKDQHLAIEFLDDGKVRFVVFAPDPKSPYQTARASGISSADSVLELVHPYKVMDWILIRGAGI